MFAQAISSSRKPAPCMVAMKGPAPGSCMPSVKVTSGVWPGAVGRRELAFEALGDATDLGTRLLDRDAIRQAADHHQVPPLRFVHASLE